MAEDNINDNEFNPEGIPPQDNDNSSINPANFDLGNTDAEIMQNAAQENPADAAGEHHENVSDYNFNEMQGNSVNEVHIENTEPNDGPVTVRPVEFTPFDSYTPTNTDTNKNLELLMDIKLELTVELGRCQLPVKKVLELTRGSIIELDKVAGESVELFANGKHVANGEVVVIEDNFGLRITSITDPEERIKSL